MLKPTPPFPWFGQVQDLQNKKLMITMLMAYKMAPLANLNLPDQYCFYYRVNGWYPALCM